MPTKTILAAALTLAQGVGQGMAEGAAEPLPSVSATTTYHRVAINGVSVFYREAGPRDAPTILLLHGYPSSSRQWDPLLPLLADRYHLIAPDYPGFGQSDAPSPAQYTYTFDNLAATMDGLVGQQRQQRVPLPRG
jgi:pimeloyl-ACP methyl ester carboxylesterase